MGAEGRHDEGQCVQIRRWADPGLGEDRQAGEPVLAPNPGAEAEDEGWILTFVYVPATDKSDLIVIDAQDFDKPPVARVHLPVRVPFGFYGSWIPDA